MEPRREIRDERAPDQPPAMPGPAFRRCALRYPPYACDPTAGGRDGISVNDNTCEFPPTTPQDGMATCSVRRQPAPDRQGNHGGECGMASSPGDGAEARKGVPATLGPAMLDRRIAWRSVTSLPESLAPAMPASDAGVAGASEAAILKIYTLQLRWRQRRRPFLKINYCQFRWAQRSW